MGGEIKLSRVSPSVKRRLCGLPEWGVRSAARCADLRRRRAVVAAERMVEGGEIAKAGGERKRADGLAGAAGIRQHAMGLVEPLAEHELRKRRALALEQLVDIARGHAVAYRERACADLVASKVLRNVGLDRMQPRGTDAGTACD